MRHLLRYARSSYRLKNVVPGQHSCPNISEPVNDSTAFAQPPLASQSFGALSLLASYAGAASVRQKLQSEDKMQSATYQVQVETGDVRGAGTQAAAMLQLVGENGNSGLISIGKHDEDSGFARGSKRVYDIEVEDDLGILRRLYVRQEDGSVTEEGNGWFLNQVVVRTPAGLEWHFPCNSWIGENDADGYAAGKERNLIPCEMPHLEQITQLPHPLRARSSAVSIPHPEKVSEGGNKAINRKQEGWGGEDAYFCTPGRYGMVGMGVADGVYMWKTQGIDAGLFSRTLMSTARHEVSNGTDDVVKLLHATADQVRVDDIQGSSTACLVLVDTLHGRLTSANLGDSGFLVLGQPKTDGEEMDVKYHSPQQEHQFGFPYQLGHHNNADSVDSAMLRTLPVQKGDIIILGSDGLWDNVSVHDISATVRKEYGKCTQPSRLAQILAAKAFGAALDKKGVTPYSLAATEAFDMVYSGGKLDDITVVVTFLT